MSHLTEGLNGAAIKAERTCGNTKYERENNKRKTLQPGRKGGLHTECQSVYQIRESEKSKTRR